MKDLYVVKGGSAKIPKVLLTDGEVEIAHAHDNFPLVECKMLRLAAGWNLLNRLEEMGVSAEQSPKMVKLFKKIQRDGRIDCSHTAIILGYPDATDWLNEAFDV